MSEHPSAAPVAQPRAPLDRLLAECDAPAPDA
jgi:hypothetical protein